ncbi:MAG: hypothetical protein J5736_00330, partial [Bacilli bacterium]|nr:hypothetical protein [Bacilli bacterium]
GEEDLLISSDARTPRSGKFAWVSHHFAYELRSYNIYKPTGNYVSYMGDFYVKEKAGDIQIELASSSTINFCGLRNEGQKYFNLGFNLQLDRISPIRRGHFDFAFGASVGANFMDGIVFRVDDLGRIWLFEDGKALIENRETSIETVSSVYLNFTYSGNHLKVRAINFGQTGYFDLLDYDFDRLHSGCFSFYSNNAGCKLNHVKGFGIQEGQDITELPSYNAPVMEEPIPTNADPMNQPAGQDYHNDFGSNSALADMDRYSGQVYIEDGSLVVNGYTTINWDAGAAIACGTFSNFEVTCRMKIGEVAASGGFIGIEFHKSSAEVNHQGTALTVLMYPGGYLALFIGNGILTSYGIQGDVDEEGYVTVTVRVQNGTLTFGGGAGNLSVNLGGLSNNNNLTSGFISLNAGAALGYFDYIDVTLL